MLLQKEVSNAMDRCDGIPIDKVAFSKQLQQLAEKWGDETALVDVSRDGSERALSRRELFEAIEKVACHLNDRNVQQGDYVVIALPNGYENVVATLAAWQLGACCVFMSPKGTDEERNHIHALFERKLLISTWDCDDEDCISQQDVRNWIRGEFPHGAEILPFFACEPSRAIPTGGSSGKPKLVVQKVRPAYCEMDLSAWTAMTGQTPWSKQLIPGSLFHNLYSNATYIGLFFGQTVYLMERFDEGQALELIEKHGIQFIGLAPTMMDRMMRHPSFQTRNLESLEAVFHSGGPCPDKVKLAWIERIGARKVYEMYGETEMIASTFIRGEEWLEHRGSVGRPFGCELQIRDEEGRALPCGEVGEIFGKPAMGLSAKYVGPQSIKSEEDGFFSVGDLGWLDEEGFLYISDRRSDMIMTGGKNVYTAEVENAIFDYPGISDAVVIGIPDQQWGLRVHAILEIEGAESEFSTDGLKEFLHTKLSGYKCPKTYEIVQDMPRNEMGKIRRRELIEQRVSSLSEREPGTKA